MGLLRGVREYYAYVGVLNVAPSATFRAPASVNEGKPIMIQRYARLLPENGGVTEYTRSVVVR